MSATPLFKVLLASLLVFNSTYLPFPQNQRVDNKLREATRKVNDPELERTVRDLSPVSEQLRLVLKETDEILKDSHKKVGSDQFPDEELALLDGELQRLRQIDQEITAIIRDINAKLNEAGLQSKLALLKEFERHYKNEMGELRNSLEGLILWGKSAASSAQPRRKSKEPRLESLRSQLARLLHQSVDGSIFGQKTLPATPDAPAINSAPPPYRRVPRPRLWPKTISEEFEALLADPARPYYPQPLVSLRKFTARSKQPTQTLVAQSDAPKREDLAASGVVKLEPEMMVKAAQLGNSPANIYEFVRNDFEFEPYSGMLQNSQAVLWSGRGNDFDLATLLITLLRAANIPARYVRGVIQLPNEQAMNWLGVRDAQTALQILRLTTGAEQAGSVIRLNHVWVEAFVDNSWVALDPSFKLKQYQPGLRIPRLAFDRMKFISTRNTTQFDASVTPKLSTEVYVQQIKDYLKQSHPGRGLSDLPYVGHIIPTRTGKLPSSLPYTVEGVASREPEVDRRLHHRAVVSVELQLFGTPIGDIAKVELSVPEVSLNSINVTFGGATQADQQTLDVFGGLNATPAFLVQLTPQISVDGNIVATGNQVLSVGTVVNVRTAYFYPTATQQAFKSDHGIQVGGVVTIGLSGHQISDEYLNRRIDRIVNGQAAPGEGDHERTVRETLHVAALRYFQRFTAERRRTSELVQFRHLQSRAEEGATMSTLNVQNLFDRPFVVTPSNMILDADGLEEFFLDVNLPPGDSPEQTNFRQMRGLTGSALEHELWEEIALINAISTTKALQAAGEQRIPILTINQQNAATELAKLQSSFPVSARQLIQNDVNRGMTVVTPDRLVIYGKWKGVGWITENANATASGYLILRTNAVSSESGIDGGDTGGNQPEDGKKNGQEGDDPSNCYRSQPVNVSNGNMLHEFDDLSVSGRGRAVRLTRTYNSQSSESGPFGHGWTHSYQLRLQEDLLGVTLRDGSGSRYTFFRESQQGRRRNLFVPAAGLNATLTTDRQGFTLREKDGTEMRFDPAGKLLSISDRNGNTQTFTHDAQGNLQTIRDALGRDITLTYDTQNRITAIQDFTGRSLAYVYDARGDLVESVDFGGNRTTYSYYSNRFNNHNLKTITSPEGSTITYVYYGNDKVFKVIEPEGNETRFIYMPLRNETYVLDERGFATVYQYNSLGNVTRIIQPDGNHIDQTYNSDAKLIARTDEAGFTSSFDYDARGNLRGATDPLGNKISFTYEPKFNLPLSLKDAKGNQTRFAYDGEGNLVKITDALGAETLFTYDANGNLLTTTDAEGNSFAIIYDASDNPVEVRDARGNTAKFKFDALRRLTSRTDALGNESRIEYDALDRVAKVTDELGNSASFVYDRDGNLTQRTDANGIITRFAFDRLNNLAQVTDALGGITKYGYGADGCSCAATPNLTSVTNAKGNTWTYSYDSRDRVTESRDPLGNLTRYRYDPRGNLVEKTDANGNTIRFEYDKLNRLTRKLFPDGSEDTFTYDANGNLLSAANQHATLTFAYDALNRVTSAADSRFGKAVGYTYDRAGRRQTMVDTEGGVTTYAYDPNGQIKTITNPKNQVTRFSYDALNRRSEMLHANNTRARYDYDAASRLLSLVHTNLNDNSIIAQSLYTYDRAGNRLTMTDTDGTRAHTYDNLYRLVAATHPNSAPESYEYDAVGNRTRSAFQDGLTYDEADRLLSIARERVDFSYDKNGNTLTQADGQGTRRYAYDVENRLTRVELPDGRTAAYKYDAFGRRLEKNVGGNVTRYFYDGADILSEFDGGNGLAARYTHGAGIDEPLVMERGGQSHFYHGDGLGSIARLTSQSSGTAQRYDYDSFGRIRNAQGNVSNAFTYTSREFDAESGLYYYRARHYEPQVGRFTSKDPGGFSGGMNLYGYVNNNPTNYIDPDGEIPVIVILVIAYRIYNAHGTAMDVRETYRTITDECSSTTEKISSVISTASGLIPGGRQARNAGKLLNFASDAEKHAKNLERLNIRAAIETYKKAAQRTSAESGPRFTDLYDIDPATGNLRYNPFRQVKP